MRTVGMVLGLAGIAVVAWQGGWLLAAGVFLAIWGNNLERGRR